jgi:hypothetical protein
MDALQEIRYQPKPFDATWALEFKILDQHNEADRLFIVRCLEGGMWSVTHPGEPVKNSDYWLDNYKGYMRKYQRACAGYYTPGDKRTKSYRLLKADMSLFNNFATVCELYYRRELKREGKPDMAALV